MTIEIIVHFDGTKSSIAFDALPTFNTLRRAIASDITDGNSSFLVIGSTQRGTPIVISDQTSFIRALGARTSMIVSVRLQQPGENNNNNINNEQNQQPSTNNNNNNNLSVSNKSVENHSSKQHLHSSSPSSQQQQHQDPFVSPSRAKVGQSSANQQHSSPFQEGIASCQQIVETNGDARCCCFVINSSTKSQKIWVGERQSGNLRIHDYGSGEIDRIIKPRSTFQSGPHSGCLSIAFVPAFVTSNNNNQGHSELQQDRVWAGFNSKDIRVYSNSPEGREQLVQTMNEHSAAVTCIESTAGGAYCFSASLDFTIIQWNVNTMTVSRIFSRHRNGVRALLFSAFASTTSMMMNSTTNDGVRQPLLFSTGEDRCLVAWDSNSGDVVAEGTNVHGSGIHALACDSEGRVWTGCEDGSVKVWEMKRLMEPVAHNSAVVSTRSNNNNNNSNSNSNKMMMMKRFECVASFREHAAGVTFIKCFKGRCLTSAHDGTIAVYDANNLQVLGDLPHPHDAPAVSIALSSFTTVFKFWTGSSDRKLCRWTLEDPGNNAQQEQHLQDINQIQKLFGLGALGGNNNNNNNQRSLATSSSNPNLSGDESNDAITLLRFTLDRTTEKTLIVAEEAKNRAELQLMFERRLRQKHFMPRNSAVEKFSEAALEIHRSFSRTLLDAHVSSCLATQAALETSSSSLAYASSEMENLNSQRSLQQQKSAQQQHQATESVSALNKRVRDLESSLAFARSEVAKSTQETRNNTDREEKLQEAYDKALQRQKVLEAELKKVRDDKSTGDTNRDKGQILKDEQWRQQEFILQGHIAEQKNTIEERDSQIRMLKMQLSSQQQLCQARENEIKNLTKANTASKDASDKAVAEERDRWTQRNKDLEEQLAKYSSESGDIQSKLNTENSELRSKLAKLEDEFATAKKDSANENTKKDAKIAELQSLVDTYSQSADSARENWQKDTETLSRDLVRTQETLNRADNYAVNIERDAAVERATLKNLEQQNNSLTTENVKLRESLILERSSAQSQIDTLEQTLAQLRQDYSEAQDDFTSEQAARSAIERRLASIERSYEELRKSVDEGAVAVTKAYETDTSALARKYRELENASNIATSQLHDDIAKLKKQNDHLEKLKEEAENETANKANDLAVLTSENRDLKTTIQNLQVANRKEVDSLRADVHDLAQTCAAEKGKNEQDALRYESEIEDLKLRISEAGQSRRKIENDLSRVTSEAAASKAKAEVISESEKKLEEEREKLVEENTALRADLTAAETKMSLLNKKLIDSERSASTANQERSRALGTTQQQLQEAQDEMLISEKRHNSMIEEMRKLGRQNEEELTRERDEAIALAKAAEERRQVQEEEINLIRQKDQSKEKDLLESLQIAEKQISSYRTQLENAESSISEWKEMATRARAEVQDHDARSNDMASQDHAKIARLEAAVAKGAEVEQLLEEQVAGYKMEAQRAREQMLLLTREVTHLRDELTATTNENHRNQHDVSTLRDENSRMQQEIEILQGEQRQSTTVAVKRLTLENEDLRRRLMSSSSSNYNNRNIMNNNESAGGFARIQQLENENEVLHGRILTLDAERNAAWKELQQLLDDHRILHRQFTDLKNNQSSHNNNNQTQQQQRQLVPSSEIALLRQQYQQQPGGSRSVSGMNTPQQQSIARDNNNNVVATRGAALASHYSELLSGIKDMTSLLQRYGNVENNNNETLNQVKDWLSTASVRGEAVANTLFTDDERRRLM